MPCRFWWTNDQSSSGWMARPRLPMHHALRCGRTDGPVRFGVDGMARTDPHTIPCEFGSDGQSKSWWMARPVLARSPCRKGSGRWMVRFVANGTARTSCYARLGGRMVLLGVVWTARALCLAGLGGRPA